MADCDCKHTMTTRNKRSAYLLAAGLVFTAAGTVIGSRLSFFVGLMVVALAARYRKNPAAWEYILHISLALAMVAWMYSSDSPLSPFIGAIPLMLSYLLDYLDERRQRRSASAQGPLNERAGNGRRLAEPGTAPNAGPAAAVGNHRIQRVQQAQTLPAA